MGRCLIHFLPSTNQLLPEVMKKAKTMINFIINFFDRYFFIKNIINGIKKTIPINLANNLMYIFPPKIYLNPSRSMF